MHAPSSAWRQSCYPADYGTASEVRIEQSYQVVLRYVDNPNGSVDDIAGVTNEGRNVVGLMPHPERASNPLLGSEDGLPLLRSFLDAAAVGA